MEPRMISGTIDIKVPAEQVYSAWTTEAGLKSFFAEHCKVNAQVGGAIELYFNMDAPEGERGSEGCVFLALQPNKLISFTWNAPPHLPEVRQQRTWVSIYLDEVTANKTKVRFYNGGYGNRGEWNAAYDYFQNAWIKQVLPNLKAALEAPHTNR